jgi:hypothetical protein
MSRDSHRIVFSIVIIIIVSAVQPPHAILRHTQDSAA